MNNELQQQVNQLQAQLNDLSSQFFKNNFSSHQDFNKSSSFNSALKVPIFTSLPSCEVGQICAYSTAGTYKLMIATAKDVWTITGTQS